MKHILYLLFVSLLVSAVTSQGITQETDWDSMIESWRKEYNVPGMSVGIIRNNEIILSKGYGVLESGKESKADQHTLYAIASNTKAFISAALATLVDEGKMNWDDKVQAHIPYFELYDPCVSSMMTIRDLLCHRSGLGTYSGDVIWYKSEYEVEEIIRRAAEIPRAFEFRSGYGYSNVMYIVAGEVIHAVSGKPWDKYVEEKFLVPLGMNRTITAVKDIPMLSNVAAPHKPESGGNTPIPWVAWDNSGAAGGIISSVDDMLKWIGFQLRHGISGSDTLLAREQQLTMWTPHVNFTVSDRAKELYLGRNFHGYGLGWGTSEYNHRLLITHTGGYDGMYSAVVLLPNENIGVVVLTNSMKGIATMLSYEILDKLLDNPQQGWKERGLNRDKAGEEERANRIKAIRDARMPGTKPTLGPSEISGHYRCKMYGDIRINEENGQLMIQFASAPGLQARLTHWHYDTWAIDWLEPQAWFGFGTVQIQKNNNQKPIGLLFDVPNDDIFFEEIHAIRLNP